MLEVLLTPQGDSNVDVHNENQGFFMGEIKEDLKENAMLLHEKSKYSKNKLFQVNFDVKIPIQNCEAPY